MNVRLAGVGSVFLALSVARTSKVWLPGESGVEGVWLAPGPEQGANAWESKRQVKVEPDSLEVKPKVGVVSAVDPAGPEVIVVWGGDGVDGEGPRTGSGSRFRGRRSP